MGRLAGMRLASAGLALTIVSSSPDRGNRFLELMGEHQLDVYLMGLRRATIERSLP